MFDMQEFSEILKQLPIVALFLAFVIWMLRRSDIRETTRDAAFAELVKTRDAQDKEHDLQRDEHWMDYLKTEREQRQTSMREGILAIEKVTTAHTLNATEVSKGLATLTQSLAAHDGTTSERYREIMQKLNEVQQHVKQKGV